MTNLVGFGYHLYENLDGKVRHLVINKVVITDNPEHRFFSATTLFIGVGSGFYNNYNSYISLSLYEPLPLYCF